MAGYNYTKRSVTVILLFTLFMAGSKKCALSLWLVTITLKEVSALFMAGYSYTKRSVHSLHDWLQLH